MKKRLTFFILVTGTFLLLLSSKQKENRAPSTDQYLVIAWNDLGMHCANKDFANMCILPPYNNQYAQVIRKGSPSQLPLVMNGTSGIYITYEIPGNTYSVGKTNFWSYSSQLFGVTLPPNVGLTGMGLVDTMVKNDLWNYQHADGIPITAFNDSVLTTEDPYQLTLIRAYSPSGQLLASTQSVIPVSHEIKCVSSGCHASELAILQKHDQVPGFNINNRPIFCATCHSDNALGMPGQPGVDPFSQVIHMKHGEFIKTGTNADCYKCHPGENTQCWRDVMHTTTGLITKCQNCHGSVYNVGKTIEEDDREPWFDEPSCGASNCHGPQYAEEPGKLFRESKGHGGLFCSACHNSPHAILPTTQPRDNVQNIALQGFSGTLKECSVCHGYTPTGPGPHGIPAIKILQNINLTGGQTNCYNATQTITTAGNGTTFNVNSGASATLIAGRSITFLPGTTVNSGGYLWGYITQKDRYCNNTLPPMAPAAPMATDASSDRMPVKINIFPNPASDEITIVFDGGIPEGKMVMEVVSSVGKRVLSQSVSLQNRHKISLSALPSGIYLVHLSGKMFNYTQKIVKQ